MITREELIKIGHYNRPHGVSGEISATVDIERKVLSDLSCLVSDIDGIFVPFFINAMRPKSSETVLLTIDGFDNEHDVQRLVNHDIFALKREFKQESEDADADGYPLDFFIGFDLNDENGNRLGTIVDVNEQTENIGARRLHTIMEKLLEDISFNAAGDMPDVEVEINGAYVAEHLGKDQRMDMKRYIL